MHTKLAGQFSLHDLIQRTINGSQVKLAESEEESKKKAPPFMKKKDEKKEEHDTEKKASAEFDVNDPDELEKLASALDEVGEKLAADSTYLGGEKKQGGEVLSTMAPVSGTQPYKHDSSKSHNVPTKTPEKSTVDNKGAATATETDDKPGKLLKYLHSKYPEKGVLKTAAESVKEKVENLKKYEEKEHGHIPSPKEEKDEKKKAFAAGEEKGEKKASAALSFVLDKMASFGAQEKKMGGETLDSAAEQGPKPESGAQGGNNVRSHIGSNKAAIDMKKVEGKAPQKKMLTEVLTEPALSKAHDSKVQENLRNASKGGVKIAAAKAFLQKIAAEGCTCEGKGECKHCKMKASLEKKSQAAK